MKAPEVFVKLLAVAERLGATCSLEIARIVSFSFALRATRENLPAFTLEAEFDVDLARGQLSASCALSLGSSRPANGDSTQLL